MTASRRIQFCAGHRVWRHESKCKHLHGHNWTLIVHASGAQDALGRVVDFGVLKDAIGGWIDRNWDHGFILWDHDIDAVLAVKALEGQKLFRLGRNPTAENLAHYVLHTVAPATLPENVTVTRVELWETENCKAEVSL